MARKCPSSVSVAALIAALSLLAGACTAPAAPAPTSTPAKTAPASTATPVPKEASKPAATPSSFNEAAEAKKLYDAAVAAGEKEVNFYTSINEREAEPYIALFHKLYPGIKVNYYRSDETALVSRILTEEQAGKHNFDVLVTTSAHVLVPAGVVLKYSPPNAALLDPAYVDKDGFWHGVYANWNVVQVNTNMVNKTEVKTYEDLTLPKFKNQLVIDDSDIEWLAGLIATRGEQPTLDLLTKIAANGVTVINGHASISDKIAAGEYGIAVNNYLNLIERNKRAGAPTDWIPVEPVIVDFSKAVVSKNAPHPNAAKLLANFVLSSEGQAQLAKSGRLPTRADVPPDPPNLVQGLKKYPSPMLLGQERENLTDKFRKIFRP